MVCRSEPLDELISTLTEATTANDPGPLTGNAGGDRATQQQKKGSTGLRQGSAPCG